MERGWPRRYRAWALVALAAVAVPTANLARGAILGSGGLWNDFASYYLAARLLAVGRDPYDLAVLKGLGSALGIHFTAGTGYSYPPPLAVGLVPLAQLPFAVAGTIFTVISLAAFGSAASWWMARAFPEVSLTRRAVASLAVGSWAPVVGSAWYGQANLLVLALLAAGLGSIELGGVVAHRHRRLFGAGLAIGLAGVVKLVPLAVLVPLALARRWLTVAGELLAVAVSLFASGLIVGPAVGGVGGAITRLFTPDGYWTNQSLNGFASRLVLPTDQTAPLIAQATLASPIGIALLAGLVAATLTIAARSQVRWSRPPTAALLLSLFLVAAVVGAPKDSVWNLSLALPALGLWAALAVPDLGSDGISPSRAVPLAATYLLAWSPDLLAGRPGPFDGPLGAVRTLAASGGLYAGLIIWGLIAWRCWRDE